MALLDIRQRTGYLFIALTVGHIVLDFCAGQYGSRRYLCSRTSRSARLRRFSALPRRRSAACERRGPTTSRCRRCEVKTNDCARRWPACAVRTTAGARAGAAGPFARGDPGTAHERRARDRGGDRDRRRCEPGFPHDHDRQGHGGGLAAQHGRHCARRSGWPDCHAERREPRRCSC